jgi:hypothetical protein
MKMRIVSLKTKKLISIGIDVGSTNGAISVISEDGEILLLTKAPIYQTEVKSKRNKSKLNKATGKFETDFRKRNWVDFKVLRELLKPFISSSVIYTIERIQQRPNEGETTSFMNGNSLGIFQGLYSYLNPVAYYEPSAGEWKKELGVTSLKDTSIQLAEEIYNVKLKDYLPKGKVDDIAEALLLSFYGFKRYYENNERKNNGNKE